MNSPTPCRLIIIALLAVQVAAATVAHAQTEWKLWLQHFLSSTYVDPIPERGSIDYATYQVVDHPFGWPGYYNSGSRSYEEWHHDVWSERYGFVH
jgi:hypothetical protein